MEGIGYKIMKVRKKQSKTSNRVLILLGIFALLFIVCMTVIYWFKGSVPDTLIQYTLGAGPERRTATSRLIRGRKRPQRTGEGRRKIRLLSGGILPQRPVRFVRSQACPGTQNPVFLTSSRGSEAGFRRAVAGYACGSLGSRNFPRNIPRRGCRVERTPRISDVLRKKGR